VIPVAKPTLDSAPSTDAMKQRALDALGKLPPFSPILNKLMASLAGEDVSFTKLGDLIEKDTVIAGNILHLVNSALYARPGEVTSVRHALSILGLDKMRNAVLSMSISRMWNQVRTPPGWSMARFNMHSASVAILSDLMAQRLPVAYPEGAFVAGLFHDLGRLLIAMGLPEEFGRALHRYEHTDRTWIECEQDTFGFTHAELSAAALAKWKLPEPIQQAAREHHQLGAMQPNEAISLGRILDAANRYVNSIRESILIQQKNDASGEAWMHSFGLAPAIVSRLESDFESEHKSMAPFFR
jgi:putative nucleotidyltransferase with HDIG domain